MEYVSGNVKLRDIFLDNGNWWKLFLKRRKLIRISIITNVLKLLVCRTAFLGYHFFICLTCGKSIKAPHSAAFWDIFWLNRYLMKDIPLLAANIIKKLCNAKGILPGIFLSLHTFGRALKRNIHIHLSTTIGGLSLSHDSWIKGNYFHHETLKNMWRYDIITLLRKEFKSGNLKLPPQLKHIKTCSAFYKWTSRFYDQTWNVHLNEQSNNMKANVEYLGKYLKRPPIGETRIKAYDGNSVTFQYLDHHTKTQDIMSLTVLDFISRLISHIPDKNFRNIRYYGFLSHRLRGKLLPIVYDLLNMRKNSKTKVYIPWRNMIQNTFNYDPLKCPVCKSVMILSHIIFHKSLNLLKMHKEIAHGYFPLL